ncbi:MAG: helix-turn-helix transcriptional regulator [Phycisphaerae bacterium]|nr:helix-turn-helix transcriptional regulator [Phycisphaerae bacterium]
MDTQRKRIEANLSADLVKYLQSQGMTLRQIGDAVGLSESFISRVGNKKRGLTIEHLLRLQDAIGKPLPLLLLEATSQDSVPEPLAPLYEKARDVLAAGMELTHSVKRRHRKTG